MLLLPPLKDLANPNHVCTPTRTSNSTIEGWEKDGASWNKSGDVFLEITWLYIKIWFEMCNVRWPFFSGEV